MTSQCPLEHCMLSDVERCLTTAARPKRLNALSSIVCFLTNPHPYDDNGGAPDGLNALSSIVCFLTLLAVLRRREHPALVSMPSRALYAF